MRNQVRGLLTRGLQVVLRLRARSLLDDLPAGRVLVVAPHPDDEALGCGRLIAILRTRNVMVDIVWLTDGEASPSDFAGGPMQLAITRRQEARAAAALLGVPEACLHHLGAPDGRLPHLSAEQRYEVITALVKLVDQLLPNSVFVTSRLDGSTEHTAAHALTSEAISLARHRPQLRAYLVWAYWKIRDLRIAVSKASSVWFLPSTPRDSLARSQAIRAHVTQTAPQPPNDQALLSPHFLECFPRTGEFFLSH